MPDRLVDSLVTWGSIGDIIERIASLCAVAPIMWLRVLPVTLGFPLRDYLHLAPSLKELST
jgi:hypothetical protein